MEFDECGIKILQEGRFRKLVKKVQQISYNGKMAVSERTEYVLCHGAGCVPADRGWSHAD